MRRPGFSNLLSRLADLTGRQLSELIVAAQAVVGANLVAGTIEAARAPMLACPSCQRGALHVQNVNAYHSRMRTWLRHFCGVASRYLVNYCGWRWAIDGERINTAQDFLRIAVAPIHS